MMKTLVTGASGFTGSHLARRLVSDGHEVVAFVRPTTDSRMLRQLGVECRVVELTDRRSVAAAFSGVSRVFHLAAAFRVEHADPGEFRRINVDATQALLEAAADAGVERFVHCSTVGVQGEICAPPATEEYRIQPGDEYQRTKLEGELAARAFGREGLPVVVVRPVGIYGPGDTRFLKLFRAVGRRRFVMIGSGATLYHLTYVEDLVDGFVLAGERPAAVGEVFTIGGAQYTTLRQLVSLIARTLDVSPPRLRVPAAPVLAAARICQLASRSIGIDPPLYPRRVEFFTKDRAFDISKARRVLGYAPRVGLEAGLARTAAWYRDRGVL